MVLSITWWWSTESLVSRTFSNLVEETLWNRTGHYFPDPLQFWEFLLISSSWATTGNKNRVFLSVIAAVLLTTPSETLLLQESLLFYCIQLACLFTWNRNRETKLSETVTHTHTQRERERKRERERERESFDVNLRFRNSCILDNSKFVET